MKRKLLLAILLGVLSFNLNAQDTQNPCKFDYTVDAKKSPELLDYKDRYVEFNWDISKISSEDMQVKIEITPIYDCFNGIDGTQTNKSTFLDLKSEDLISKTKISIKHVDMLAKCFKWRVILVTDSCSEQTEWNYYSFID